MNQYHRKNRACYAGALICVLISTLFAVGLQFFKGAVLDYAVAGQQRETYRSAAFLILFILCEVLIMWIIRRGSRGSTFQYIPTRPT